MARSPIHFTLATLALFFISSAVAEFLTLTQDNFEKEVGQDRDALVEFYAPWCGHCKKIAPEFERVGNGFKKAKSVLIGKVDCDEHKDVCTKYDVTSYPTIKYFPKGSLEPKLYDGERNAEKFAEYVNSQAGTFVKVSAVGSNVVALTSYNFNTIVMDKTKHVLVEFYAPWCGYCQNVAPIYESLGDAFKNEDDIVIASINADIYKRPAERYNVETIPKFIFFSKDNKDGEDVPGKPTLESLLNFVNDKCGTSRDGEGQLTSNAGIIEMLDVLVKEFKSAAGEDDKQEVYAKIEEEAANLNGSLARYGKIYIKAAHSYMVKGADYAKNEIQRIERLLSKSISSVKADEFTLKKNILSAFT
ncbi:protein disulfide-isomerase like 2-1 [Lactuca sativa]|uniref:protein disulfide-isomerase n=1 Tax=Lactuca sativa TaxID=4236 RepID=A0A9R1V006_LACSA|nr:protein disulfide-isomerase like 2-1 [Lactuca sativa]KAJ0195806.1 hypothetical protein LSAT_V11C700370900 [Lactuca sativa]